MWKIVLRLAAAILLAIGLPRQISEYKANRERLIFWKLVGVVVLIICAVLTAVLDLICM